MSIYVRATKHVSLLLFACFCSLLAVAQSAPNSQDDRESADATAALCDDEINRGLEKQRALLDRLNQAVQKDETIDAIAVLEKLELPKNPTREQCVAYLESVALAAELIGLWRDGQSEPIQRKLVGVFPPEHVDLLLNEVAKGTRLRASARVAVRAMKLEPGVVRQRVAAHLEESPALIGIVLRNGWCEDARPLIIRTVLECEELPTPEWFVAAVELKEPKLYPKLHELTVRSKHAVNFIKTLTALPDYDLPHTISAVFKRVEAGKLKFKYAGIEKELQLMAAERGDVEALGHVINDVHGTGHLTPRDDDGYRISNYSEPFDSPRMKIIRLIAFKGSNEEIKDWYEANRDRLAFDGFRRQFVVAGED